MSTPQTYELGWLSYLSNILSPAGQKVGVKKNFCSLRSQNLCPTFKTVVPPLPVKASWTHTAKPWQMQFLRKEAQKTAPVFWCQFQARVIGMRDWTSGASWRHTTAPFSRASPAPDYQHLLRTDREVAGFRADCVSNGSPNSDGSRFGLTHQPEKA